MMDERATSISRIVLKNNKDGTFDIVKNNYGLKDSLPMSRITEVLAIDWSEIYITSKKEEQ
jgi:hypothetical protein